MRNTVALLKWPAMIAGTGGAAQGVSALSAGVVGLTGALGPLSGALAAAPAALGSFAQGLGTALLATSGLKEVLSGMSDVQAQAGQSAQAAGQAQRAAAEQVRSAEESLASAQRTVKFAQEDLTAARKDAARQLHDMRLEAEGAALGEERALLSVQQARDSLREVRQDPSSTYLDERDALLAVEEAQLGVKEARTENNRSQKDLTRAEKTGVSGSEQVVGARRSLADAQRQAAESTRALANAQRDAAEGMAEGSSAATALQQKMAALPPAARQFARFLYGLKPALDQLRSTAAAGIFPGLQRGIQAAMKNFPALQKVIGMTSGVLGDLAEKAGRFVGRGAFGRDFERIGRSNARLIGRYGQVALNLADALRHVMVAARPLVGWMSKMAVSWSENLANAAKAGRESGKMEHFFRQTRKMLERVFSIAGSVIGAFGQISSIAAPLGRSVLAALDKAAGRFEDWTKSARGKNELQEYFKNARAPLFEMGRLMRDVVKGFFSLSQTTGLSKLIRLVRTDLLPALLRMIRVTTEEFLPVLVRFGVAWAKMMTVFLSSSGPLNHFVGLLATIVEGFNKLPDGVKSTFGALITFGLIIKGIAWAGAITGLSKLLHLYRVMPGAIAGATGAAKGQQLLAPGQTAGMLSSSTVATQQGGKMGGALKAGIIGSLGSLGIGAAIVGAFSAATTSGGVLDTIRGKGHGVGKEFMAGVNSGFSGQIQQAVSEGNIGGLQKLRDVLRRGADEYEGFDDRASAALRHLAGVAARSADQLRMDKARKGIRELGKTFYLTLPQIQGAVRSNMGTIADIFGTKSRQAKQALSDNFDAGIKAIRRAMASGVISAKQGLAEINRLITKQLALFGLSRKEIVKITPLKLPELGPMPKGPRTPIGQQRGGTVVPGVGTGDRVPLHIGGRLAAMVESGELVSVANRKATAALMAANQAVPRFAKGGRLPQFGSTHPMGHAVAGGLNKVSKAGDALLKVAKRMGRQKEEGLGAVPRGSGTALMKAISKRKGWNFADWWALDAAESGHGTNLVNPTSTARLRGQFLDMNWGKYGPGSDPTPWPSMRDQIISMARYIAERYGNPSKAWAFHQGNNYYQRGGVLDLQRGGVPRRGQPFDERLMRGTATGPPRLNRADQVGGHLPKTIGRIKAKADAIANSFTGYVWGGGHNAGAVTTNGLDCSGAIAKLMQQSGWPDFQSAHSSVYASRFKPGVGDKFSLWSNEGHTFAEILGKMWGTNSSTGLGYHSHPTAGFTATHPDLARVAAPQGRVAAGPKPPTKAEKRKAKHQKLKNKLEKIRASTRKLGLDPQTQDRIDDLTGKASRFEEYAQDAASIGTDDVLGIFQGQSEVYWLQQQLDTLFGVRNTLAQFYNLLDAVREKIKRENDWWHDQIVRIRAIPAKDRSQQQKDRLVSYSIALARGQATLRGLNTSIGIEAGEGAGGILGSLAELQGTGLTKQVLPNLGFGQLGGQLLDVQVALRDAGARGTSSDVNNESLELQRQLTREANQRTAVSEAGFAVLRDFPPFGGIAHEGAIVPGPRGAERTMVTRSGEGIFTEEQMRAMGGGDSNVRVIVEDHRIRVFRNDVEQAVETVTRRQARRGRYPLPSRGGG